MKSVVGVFSEYYQELAVERRADRFLPYPRGQPRLSANLTGTWRLPTASGTMARCFGRLLSLAGATSAFASATLDVLVNAAASFSATIQQQREMLQSDPSPAGLAEKTIDYAEARAAYFKALRAEGAGIDEDCDRQRGEAPELDTFAAAFAVAPSTN